MNVYSRFGFIAGIVGGLAVAAPLQPGATSAKAAASSPGTNSPNSSNPTTATPTTTGSVSLPGQSKAFGVFEIRPTNANKNGVVETEDTIELGYQFNPNVKLSYAQYFITDLFPKAGSGKGVNLRGDGGFLRLKVTNIWVSDSKKTSLQYQGRIYTPTDATLVTAGYVGTLYNALRLQQDIGPVKLGFAEIPMVQAFSKNGFMDDGTPTANPIYQNRNELTVDVNIVKNLTFSLPIILDVFHNHNFAGAQYSNRLQSKLWIWPEINYEINGTHTVGIGFRSANLVSPDFSKTTIEDAFKKGWMQAIWTVSI